MTSRRYIVGAVLAATLATTTAWATTPAAQAADQATGPGRFRAMTDQPVAGNYIVVLADPDDTVSTSIRLATTHKAQVTQTYKHALNGFAARMSEVDAKALSADPAVRYVQQDGYVFATAGQYLPPSWGINRIDQRALPINDYYMYREWGAGAHAYVVDSGILRNHVGFGDRATVVRDFVNDGRGGADCNGHGTHVAGTIGSSKHGVAKGVGVHALRVFGCDGGAQQSWLIGAMDWLVANAQRPAVANMSLGGPRSQAFEDSVRSVVAAGIPVVVSAGNDGQDACGEAPAAIPEVITVASSNRRDRRSGFSNIGPCVDLFAPGEDITSTWHTHRAATQTLSGTSMAAPHVTGVVARILGRSPTMTPAEVAFEVIQTATFNVIPDPGPRTPNLLLWAPPA